jgi:hypothetical protein
MPIEPKAVSLREPTSGYIEVKSSTKPEWRSPVLIRMDIKKTLFGTGSSMDGPLTASSLS